MDSRVIVVISLSFIVIAAMYFEAWVIAGAMCFLIFLVVGG